MQKCCFSACLSVRPDTIPSQWHKKQNRLTQGCPAYLIFLPEHGPQPATALRPHSKATIQNINTAPTTTETLDPISKRTSLTGISVNTPASSQCSLICPHALAAGWLLGHFTVTHASHSTETGVQAHFDGRVTNWKSSLFTCTVGNRGCCRFLEIGSLMGKTSEKGDCQTNVASWLLNALATYAGLDDCACCHTKTEAADWTYSLTQSQCTVTRQTRPSTDPVMPVAWQGRHKSTNI